MPEQNELAKEPSEGWREPHGIQNADAAAGAVGTRGAVSGVTDSRASP
jgi:hypothetical protein